LAAKPDMRKSGLLYEEMSKCLFIQYSIYEETFQLV
jgi:hypothetical protein